jgi:DNA invertase Pin-like site-specific DNA recombinase
MAQMDSFLLQTDPPSSPVPLRAAQYVRMSTEHQQYSTLNQMDALRVYAIQRGIEIVCTYADEGKSGLTFEKRPALRQLIQDVVSGAADYTLVLVYDVSRWGRFQDADESAHYEFLCRQAGIHIRYCAEPFENDGSPLSSLAKAMKRMMAAEYSRELSRKVFFGQVRSVKMGFHPGSSAAFGLRRLILDKDRNPQRVLEFGEHKRLMTDRVVLAPGPKHEVALVRSIFRAYVSGQTFKQIADNLNMRGVPSPRGKLWSTSYIGALIHNEKYVGNNVWNKTSAKFRSRQVPNAPSEWIRANGVFKPIVSRETFARAQEVVEARKLPWSDTAIIDSLRRLLAEKGRLSLGLIAADKRTPSPGTFSRRRGGLLKAYEDLGYTPRRNWRLIDVNLDLLVHRNRIAREIAEECQRRGQRPALSRDGRVVAVEAFRILVVVVRHRRIKSGSDRWWFRPVCVDRSGANIILTTRMKPGNTDILDYYLFPHAEINKQLWRMKERNEPSAEAYRATTLEPLYAMVEHGNSDGMSMSERIACAVAECEQRPAS